MEEIDEFINEYSINLFYSVSSKTGRNVEEVFKKLTEYMVN